MPIILFLVLLLPGCVNRYGYPTAQDPHAKLVSEKKLSKNCKLMGIFEATGRTPEESVEYLRVRVAEAGASHLVVTTWRPINQNVPLEVQWLNGTLFYPTDKVSTVATGKGYSCGN